MIRYYTKKLLVFFIAIIGIVLLATLFGCNGKETSDPGYRDSTIQNWMESVVESAGYSTDEIAIDWNIVDPDRQEQANSTSNFDFREASSCSLATLLKSALKFPLIWHKPSRSQALHLT